MKKVYLRTFGCQMNKRDSELMAVLLHGDYKDFEEVLVDL